MKAYFKVYFSLIGLCLMSCGGDDTTEQEPPMLSRIVISPIPNRLDIGESVVLSIAGKDQYNDDFEIESLVEWSTNNNNASVDQNGTVTGLLVGDVTVTATVESLSQNAEIRVWDSSAPRTEIYVTDAAQFGNGGAYKVIRYDDLGKYSETLITSNLAWPQDIVFLEEDGTMLVSNLSSKKIEIFDINTGAHKGTFATISNGPTRMKIGSDNLLYVLQWNNSQGVLRYDLNGNFVDTFSSTGIDRAIGMDWDSKGNFYVSSFQGSVRKFDSKGNDLGTLISSNLQGPTNIWITASQEMLVLDWTGGAIKKFDLSGNFNGTVASGLSKPEGIDMLPNGKFLIGNGGTSNLKVLSSGGTFESDLFASGFGGLSAPNGVIIRQVNQ